MPPGLVRLHRAVLLSWATLGLALAEGISGWPSPSDHYAEDIPAHSDESFRVPAPRPGLAVFTLVRGGAVDDFDMFFNSRRCLRDVMPSLVLYDDIAFHEGNVPPKVQTAMQHQM